MSEILSFLQRRWKAKLIKKYKKEREKLKTWEKKKQTFTANRQRRRSFERGLTQKTGEMLREKYTGDNLHRSAS